MLRTIVFICGAALMALELVAARLLAPVLGNSIFVWGAVISVVMIALSIGYWLGGQLADRYRPAHLLAPLIAAGGLATVIAPTIAQPTLMAVSGLDPRIGALIASAVIFFVPSILLATVSPLAVRLAADSGLERIGRSAGGLYAVSTAGSVVGTLATSFWLIPVLSLEPLVVAVGFTLAGCSLLALVLTRSSEAAASAVEEGAGVAGQLGSIARPALATLGLAVAGLAVGGVVLAGGVSVQAKNTEGETVLLRQDSQYHRITVTEAGGIRHLRFDASNQSAILLADGYTSKIRYPNYLDLAIALKPDARRVLVLGLGGGAVTKRWWRDYPDMTIDTVEIDPAVVDVARRYFALPTDPRLRVFNEDARRFVKRASGTYDIVIVDCYYSDSIPAHLTTSEFFGEVKERLAPDGVVAYNVIGAVKGDDSRLFRSVYRTVLEQFGREWVFGIGLAEDGAVREPRNIIVLATDSALSNQTLLARIRSRVGGRVKVAGFPDFADDMYTSTPAMADVPVLTDAYAPTDSLIKVMP
ncbi:MAG TPA: fused MFS/spermidine synthase [Coriobacteriia bacterium]|nr:fused MFS/spermidine synthase [Coriobacteriia bacterium]